MLKTATKSFYDACMPNQFLMQLPVEGGVHVYMRKLTQFMMGILLKRLLIMSVAILLAVLCNGTFVGWLNIVPWALAAIIVGQISINCWDVVINGALLGSLLFGAYIICGYKGNTDTNSIMGFSLYLIPLSIIGGLAGVAGAFIGYYIRVKQASKVS